MSAVRILLVDDQEVVRVGFRAVLGRLDWVDRCVGVGTCAEAVELARRYDPQVALVDLYLGEESGLDVSRTLRQVNPEMRIMLMSDAGRVSPSVAHGAGACGLVQKDWPVLRLIEAVRLASTGRHVFMRLEDPAACQTLTQRERDVLRELTRGLSNPEVASVLHLSRHTVKQHTSAVYRKLGVRNRAAAASRAQQLGLAA